MVTVVATQRALAALKCNGAQLALTVRKNVVQALKLDDFLVEVWVTSMVRKRVPWHLSLRAATASATMS